jgi:hypothetical protein
LIRFDSIRFDAIPFDSIRLDLIRFDSTRFDSIDPADRPCLPATTMIVDRSIHPSRPIFSSGNDEDHRPTDPSIPPIFASANHDDRRSRRSSLLATTMMIGDRSVHPADLLFRQPRR